MRTHTIRIALLACALATSFTFGTARSAHADTVVMGTDRTTGGEGSGDRQTLDDIRQRMRDLRH